MFTYTQITMGLQHTCLLAGRQQKTGGLGRALKTPQSRKSKKVSAPNQAGTHVEKSYKNTGHA